MLLTKYFCTKSKKDIVFKKELYDTSALSILGSVLNTSCQDNFDTEACTKSVSVKFMITLKDENELQNLGDSKEQRDKLKPQEADVPMEMLESLSNMSKKYQEK